MYLIKIDGQIYRCPKRPNRLIDTGVGVPVSENERRKAKKDPCLQWLPEYYLSAPEKKLALSIASAAWIKVFESGVNPEKFLKEFRKEFNKLKEEDEKNAKAALHSSNL